jgi:hypothetical protein
MKFLVSLLSIALASATMPVYSNSRKLQKLPDSVEVNSKLGEKIMANARRLENGNGEQYITWVANYSIKFQGCHHISQWNDEADGEEDVRIATKRLVRFRLCPTNMCSLESAAGCSSGYGDYVIDMNLYLEAFLESVDEYNQARCEYLEATSGCDNDNNNNGNQDYCLYDYYASHGMADVCAEENPYQNNYNNNGNNGEQFQLADYTECAQADLWNNNNNNGGRRLDNAVEYYMGPYCAEQGGSIYLGLFTDDSCTTFADDYGGKEAYYSMTGRELPYGETNMITMDCYSCQSAEYQYNYNNNGNNNNNNNGGQDSVSELCQMVYTQAGKCESNLEVQGLYPNYNACSYIQGIQVIRKNGIIVSSGSKANKTASIFIGIFVVAFVLLSAYVYYLKTKLDRATISLDN